MKYKAKKSLGQNFLVDKNVAINIANSINVKENDLVIEIGPGKGMLTNELKKHRCNLLCYEIDTDMKQFLTEVEDDKTKIIYKDFMKANIKADIKDYKVNKKYIIANIPYYITTPIVKNIIESKIDFDEIVLMVQNELANRFTAKVGSHSYSNLTVFLNYYFEIQKLFVVKNTSFKPVPLPHSAVIKFVSKKEINRVADYKIFTELVNQAFIHRRKTIKNNLKDIDQNVLDNVLSINNLSTLVRPQDISLDVYIELANELVKKYQL